jgi:hypothetical protein
MTAHAALSSSGGMLGLLGAGSVGATASLTGSGTVEANTTSFWYPSTNGPASGISYGGNIVVGLQFKCTAAGHTFLGYAWWVQAGTNPNPTTAQKFCLYTWVSSTWSIVPGSTVTSGALSVGWNEVLLGSGISLVENQLYQVATGLTGNFNDQQDQFASGDPYQDGLTVGPLFAFSDLGGPFQSPASIPQGAFGVTSNDPTVDQPTTDDEASNFWIDVIVQ